MIMFISILGFQKCSLYGAVYLFQLSTVPRGFCAVVHQRAAFSCLPAWFYTGSYIKLENFPLYFTNYSMKVEKIEK